MVCKFTHINFVCVYTSTHAYKHTINTIQYYHRVLDDLYLINATLMSGVDTMLVSNDRFRDHLHHVASSCPLTIRLLKQWQLGSQVKMLFKNGSLFALVVSSLMYISNI